ncbi:DUF971 domain-containing protein [Paraburkholderia solisilvae]|uniref:Gamma-butyrobetaine hydroxylase-like N-terminal domain-containing protein n=1 Tax=Paraburkholderia solisilvae TaxID=624376 RepID=A0A6J5DIF1_9BURK|nr:gamma-butyrobetaine hydroxylase-like domain-containing protein [Paraburkholderia solisilvae]CAB3754020.1 hypothetical protein LMG29739_01864 [Paraburkholderia solisilvae]
MRTPAEIHTNAAARILTLHWADGKTQTITHAQLRRACPCSACRAARLAGRDIAIAPDVTLTGVEPMGYGAQLLFSDGHARGIFPWTYLESVAQQHGAVR